MQLARFLLVADGAVYDGGDAVDGAVDRRAAIHDRLDTQLEHLPRRHAVRAQRSHIHRIEQIVRRTCNILSLAERRQELGKRFFQKIIKDKSNVLFYLLPAKRDVQLTTRQRRARQYPSIYAQIDFSQFLALILMNVH